MNAPFRTGYVAIAGEPNVGKSTLMNTLIGAKLSIVTHKPQTTRRSVLGIYTNDHAQIIFVDTPGVLTPRYLLQEKMAGYVTDALTNADAIVLMLDVNAPNLEPLASTALGNVTTLNKPIVLVLNKMDTLHDKKVALPIIAKFSAMNLFADIVPVSALKHENTDRLPEVLASHLPEGQPLYDPDMLSEQPQRFFVSEIIREHVLQLYHKEIPYAVEIGIVEFKERGQGKTFISAEIIVERESQKRVVIGAKGEALKRLGSKARAAIEEFLEHQVFLELYVKVRENWRSSEGRLKSFGY